MRRERTLYLRSTKLKNYKSKNKTTAAIDERMARSRHWSGFRQFIKDNPTKWRIKLWVLADSSNSFTVDFNIYIGRAAGQEVGANGLEYNAVRRLMAPYLNLGYYLFVDKFYSSLTLFYLIGVSWPQVQF